jgi:hypothetical protein
MATRAGFVWRDSDDTLTLRVSALRIYELRICALRI